MMRKALPEDKKQIIDLWKYCFNDSQEFIDFYFDHIYKDDNTLLIEEEGLVVTNCQLNQHRLQVFGEEQQTSYVVGVATLPEKRGHGYMKKLLKASFMEMRRRGQWLSMLMPIDNRLYERFGYAFVQDRMVYKLPIGQLPMLKRDEMDKAITLHRVSGEAGQEQLKSLAQYHQQQQKGYHIRVNRSPEAFSLLVRQMEADDGYMYVIKENDVIQGYVAYYLGEDIEVTELSYTNRKVLTHILHFLGQHGTQVQNFKIWDEVRGHLGSILPVNKHVTRVVKPFMMMRILDAKKAFQSMPIPEGLNEELRLVISVQDEWISENQNVLEIQVSQDGWRVCGSVKTPDVTLSIGDLASLLYGYKYFEDIVFSEGKHYNDKIAKFFDMIVPRRLRIDLNEYI